jgi:hypothetical protein
MQNIWAVLNLDDTASDATVYEWTQAAGIPACINFVFKSPFSNLWTYNTSYGGNVPMPVAPWTIAISSAKDPRFKWTTAGLCVPPFHQATIGHFGGESSAEMGARMWHEILHAYDLPADNLQTTERAGFTEYLRTTGSPHYTGFLANPLAYENGANHTQLLISFYTYLMKKYLDCECFREGCGEQPVVPSNGGSQESEESSTSDNTTLLIIGGGLLLLILLAR